MHRYYSLTLAALASMILAAPPSWTQDLTSPEILSAVVAPATNQLTVGGRGFSPRGHSPVVLLGGAELTLVSFTDTTVVASLPPGLAAGAYNLKLRNGEGQIATFTAIIGAGGTAILSGTCGGEGEEGQSGATQGVIGLAGLNTWCFTGTTQPADPDAPGAALPMPSAGALNNLALVGYFSNYGAPSPAIQYAISVAVNGTATDLTCTVAMPAGASGGPFTCSDQADTVAVNAGDLVSLIIAPSNSTIPALTLTVSLEKH
jgi:hypothetical protein